MLVKQASLFLFHILSKDKAYMFLFKNKTSCLKTFLELSIFISLCNFFKHLKNYFRRSFRKKLALFIKELNNEQNKKITLKIT